MISDSDAALLKQALSSASAAAAAKTWHFANFANLQAVVNFVNAAPPQGAGEVCISNRPNGTVDALYYL